MKIISIEIINVKTEFAPDTSTWQPVVVKINTDEGICGGITEGKKICDMAHVYDVRVQPHICGGPIATAAALQLEAVIPNFIIHETHRFSLLEGNIVTCKYDYQPQNGYYEVPERPGIGQELTDEIMAVSYIEKIQ
ncbi:hypothetical protein AB840_00675 [Megasphaera cerevisiae DSM 20462]|uniref:Enolase C-terminal domain-containing protein n=1 Tax=Megasphaera cerevisiae DSM 20462 TaxID=1122219 RepID=A0A0J6ZSJ0_9FIRM|nr:enolase C-terminal domain-like protein [Megasphaera cerevisiae]KMO87926.1 hypothetical protein AB840_00675 [Megasphaera cerevisiae DSM 20462]SJZ43768.1 L-alanine-DL-glutamate epimerase and related enzymes of enolase superfamily [Megasphaera cerevisiae DSM 20462]